METRKILAVLILAFGLTVRPAQLCEAVEMGTAFTYQGHLYDANRPADGRYDFDFKLFDDPYTGSQQGSAIDVNEVDVIDAYFTVELDFGSGVFDGNTRWLEIGVRAGELEDPNEYTVLSPRQEVTPTPYAVYAKTAGAVSGGMGGSGTANYLAKFTSGNTLGDSIIYENAGKVGIGTTNPGAALDIQGNNQKVKIGSYLWLNYGGPGTTPDIRGTGLTLTQNNIGYPLRLISWTDSTYSEAISILTKDASAALTERLTFSGMETPGRIGLLNSNVGIGTTSPAYKLDVSGDIRSTGIIYGTVDNYYSESQSDSRFVNATGDSMSGLSSGAVLSVTNSGTGRAISGFASNSGTGTNYGGYFEAQGEQGRGIYAKATAGGDVVNYGGYFESPSRYGAAVYGEASHSYGGKGIYGKAIGDAGFGVYGETSGYINAGVYGTSTSETYGNGVYGYAPGSNGTGVKGSGGEYNFYATGPGIDYGSSSSIRWKSDVRPIDDPLGKVMNLRGVYFNWDAKHGGEHDVGMIAEEVGEVLPEIVQYEEDGKYTSGMDYSRLTPLLVEAVKELKGENERLKDRIEALERAIQQHQFGMAKEVQQ